MTKQIKRVGFQIKISPDKIDGNKFSDELWNNFVEPDGDLSDQANDVMVRAAKSSVASVLGEDSEDFADVIIHFDAYPERTEMSDSFYVEIQICQQLGEAEKALAIKVNRGRADITTAIVTALHNLAGSLYGDSSHLYHGFKYGYTDTRYTEQVKHTSEFTVDISNVDELNPLILGKIMLGFLKRDVLKHVVNDWDAPFLDLEYGVDGIILGDVYQYIFSVSVDVENQEALEKMKSPKFQESFSRAFRATLANASNAKILIKIPKEWEV